MRHARDARVVIADGLLAFPRGFLEIWMKLVLSSTIGFLLTLLANFGLAIYVASSGGTPALPHSADQRFLTLAIWGFIALSIWRFSARWLPVFLGLQKPDDAMLVMALAGVANGPNRLGLRSAHAGACPLQKFRTLGLG